MPTLSQHASVQSIAKDVLAALGASLSSEDTETTIAERAVALLLERGIEETWYYSCPAFVLLGSRSCESISGRSYLPTHESVGAINLVTVDLSPVSYGAWGDCARSFPIEDGRCTFSPRDVELTRGLEIEAVLHREMQVFARPTTTFEELFEFGNAHIKRLGYENLDFQGNLGHSIASVREDRCYIEPGNVKTLAAAPYFTYEPHVRVAGGKWGFKHEEIYYFDAEQRLNAL